MSYSIIRQALKAKRQAMDSHFIAKVPAMDSHFIAKVPAMDSTTSFDNYCARFAADAEALFAVSGRAQDKDQADHWRALARKSKA